MSCLVRVLTLTLLLSSTPAIVAGTAVTEGASKSAEQAEAPAGAISFWPWAGVEDPRLGDPSGFLVHLISSHSQGFELIEPAGTWLSPAPGEYFFWLEGRTSISPFRSPVDYEPGTTSVHQSSPVVPAGTIRWSHKKVNLADADSKAWLLHLDSHLFRGTVEHEMIREVSLEEAAEGLLMPAGSVVACLWEKETGNLLALSSVVQVPALGFAEVTAERPAQDKSALFVTLVRPAEVTSRNAADVGVDLVASGGGRIAPGAIIRGRSRIHVFWTDVSPGDMALEARGSTVGLPATTVRLRPGRAEYQEIRLETLPSLEVSFELPPQFDGLDRKLRIVDRDQGTFFERHLDRGQDSILLDGVPAARLRVLGVVGTWELREDVDMRDWRPASVTLVADAVAVHGTVYYGSEPHPARIVYTTGEVAGPLRVETDTEGRYEALFLKPATYLAEIVLEGRSLPFAILCEIESSGKVDLHTPANEFTFHVLDESTGQSIEGAEVLVQNRRDDEMGTITSLSGATDGEGRIVVHPMAAGVLEYRAEAQGYFPSALREEEVPESGETFARDIEIRLDAMTEVRNVTLLLATGAPAGGAELMVLSPLGGARWQGTANGIGRVEIPLSIRGAEVLVRHPAAGASVRVWDGSEARWTLAPLGAPLQIRAVSVSGGEVIPWAGAVVWVEGIRLDDRALTWLSGSPAQAGPDGVLRWSNPPALPLAAVVYRPDASVLPVVGSGAYDSQRTEIPYPWATVVEIVAIQ